MVDVGQAMASVTPVVDGFVLRKGGFTISNTESRLTLLRSRLF